MTTRNNNSMTKTVNFTIGLALLMMLFPIGGKTSGKPAGVRTAVELIANKPTLRKIV